MRSPLPLLLAVLMLAAPLAHAQLRLPAIISDGMVLQQSQANPIWGWDTPGTAVTVTFAG
ncbi:MAG: sialate O-acetylesterase, partial [Verrucomicrobia bacterium]|nr:sialate O-acetylesterase [Verrucomicrobiota bacterium]